MASVAPRSLVLASGPAAPAALQRGALGARGAPRATASPPRRLAARALLAPPSLLLLARGRGRPRVDVAERGRCARTRASGSEAWSTFFADPGGALQVVGAAVAVVTPLVTAFWVVAQLTAGQSTLQAGQTALQAGLTTLQVGLTALQTGQTALQAGLTALQTGQTAMQAGQTALQTGQTALQAGQTALEKRAKKADKRLAALHSGQDKLSTSVAALQAGQTALEKRAKADKRLAALHSGQEKPGASAAALQAGQTPLQAGQADAMQLLTRIADAVEPLPFAVRGLAAASREAAGDTPLSPFVTQTPDQLRTLLHELNLAQYEPLLVPMGAPALALATDASLLRAGVSVAPHRALLLSAFRDAGRGRA